MTTLQMLITIGIMALAVIATRAVSFLAFPTEKHTPAFVRFLGRYLPSAVFGMLVIYCLKDVHWAAAPHGFPQIIGILVCVLLHLWKKNMFLTIAGGTIVYMILVQTVFVWV